MGLDHTVLKVSGAHECTVLKVSKVLNKCVWGPLEIVWVWDYSEIRCHNVWHVDMHTRTCTWMSLSSALMPLSEDVTFLLHQCVVLMCVHCRRFQILISLHRAWDFEHWGLFNANLCVYHSLFPSVVLCYAVHRSDAQILFTTLFQWIRFSSGVYVCFIVLGNSSQFAGSDC